jgi:hypothetical protein
MANNEPPTFETTVAQNNHRDKGSMDVGHAAAE